MKWSLYVAGLAAVAGPLPAQDLSYDLGTITLESESDTTLKQDGYVASEGRQATKVDTPISQIPQAISTVTVDQIADQAPRTVNETLSYTAAADPYSFGYDSRFDAFNLRGFPAYYDGIFRDGLRQYNSPTALFKNEPYGLEAMAVLKGPASSLYGASGPGGIVNMVSKRPKDERFRELRMEFGQHDRYEFGADFSGPLRQDGGARYRVTGLMRKSNTHLPGFPDDKYYFAPALSFDLGERTEITFLGEISHSLTGGVAGYYNPGVGEVSDLYAGDPNYNDFDQKQWRLGYELTHRLNDTVTFRQNFRHSSVDADLQYSGLYPGGSTLARYWGHYAEDMSAQTLDTMFEFAFTTGAVDHKLLAGVDLTRSEYDSTQALGYVSAEDTAATPLAFDGALQMDQAGAYLHDQLSWRNLTAFASVRFDMARIESETAAREHRVQNDQGGSARFGLSYAMDNGLTFYGNLASSFLPVPQLVYDDVTIDATRPANPTKALQQEIGVKYQIPGTNSLLSAALFNIDADDQLILDASTGVNRARQVDISARGIELEGVANFESGWSVIGSMAYQRVTFSKDDPNFAGKRVNAVPATTAALWVKHDFNNGAMKGLGIAAGLRRVGATFGDDANTIKNDARSFVDLGLSYDLPQMPTAQLQVNVRNLFGTRKTTCASSTCYRDEGRMVTLGLTRRF